MRSEVSASPHAKCTCMLLPTLSALAQQFEGLKCPVHQKTESTNKLRIEAITRNGKEMDNKIDNEPMISRLTCLSYSVLHSLEKMSA
jgi:hypothetical protein